MKNTAFLCGVFRLHLFWRHRLEVPPRFELGSGAFAELCLTTWLWHHFVQGMRFRGRILPREKTGQSFFAPFGASDEARTRYLHLGKVALYQMSYTRNNSGYYSVTWPKSQPLFLQKQKKFFRRRFGSEFPPEDPDGRAAVPSPRFLII